MNRISGLTIVRAIFFAAALLTMLSCTTTLAPDGGRTEKKTAANPTSGPSPEEITGIFENARARLSVDPGERTGQAPLIMVHYMPWFEAPPASSGYGYHWHMGGSKFDPYTVSPDGKAQIASHYYPLTGPYDSSDRDLLEYQVSLMKLAGIDGVIFDWYGTVEALDYASVHRSTMDMIEVLEEAGLKFMICYEDQTMGKLLEANAIGKSEVFDTTRKIFEFVSEEMFTSPSYLRLDGRPVFSMFGPQYFKNPDNWKQVYSYFGEAPLFISLDDHADSFSDGSYPWPPMHLSNGGTLDIPSLVQYLNKYYTAEENRKYMMTSAFPGFHDIYREATGGKSYGYLNDYNGETFKFTFDAALSANPDIIQIVTWNDYGEGTIIEPTIEKGYRDLEFLQKYAAKNQKDFPFTAEDLPIPLEIYRMRKDEKTGDALREKLADVTTALFKGDYGKLEESITAAGIHAPENLSPMLMKSKAPETAAAMSAFDTTGLENLAVGKKATGSSNIYEFYPMNAVDGKTATYWEGGTNSYPDSVTVDLKKETDLKALVIKLNPNRIWPARTQTIEVQLSSDGENYDTAVPAASCRFDPVANGNSISIPLGGSARFVRLIITANSGAGAGQIAELEIY